ncbi:MAG: metal ABC transporter ATP-binding protein [bacterium]
MSGERTRGADPAIEVSNVCFAYNGQEVLHNVSFQIGQKSLVAVVGPNGGGKTTLLKLLLGELAPRFGTIRVLGGAPLETRVRIGYVPQVVPFDPRFPVSVSEAVLMGRVAKSRFGHYGRADHGAVRDALERVGLAGFERRFFAELSGGERQRVLIAQALAGGSELLLLDEPVANVDPEHTSYLYELFKALTSEVTVMMVSHNLSVVTGHATHVLCVNRTAGLQAIGEVASETFTEAFGGSLTTIRHDADCHVMDPSTALDAPHHGCGT